MSTRFLRFALVLLGCAFPLMDARSAPAQGERAPGADYVSLTAWLRDRNFDIRWIKRDEMLLATNRTAKVRFMMESREAWINDVHVWLLFPLLQRSGQTLIAQRDLDTTLRPVLFPTRNRPGTKVQTICLDAGHGG